MKVLCIVVVSAIVLTEAGRLRQNSPKLMVYEIREREDGSGPDVQMLKVPGDVLYKTISSLQEPAEEEEDTGLDVHKLLLTLLNKPKVNKKREKQRSTLQALKNLVKKLEKEYELGDVIQTNDKNSNDDDENSNYFQLPQGLQKVQAKPEKQNNPLVSLPLQIALRSRVEDEDRDDDDMSSGDDRTMPPRVSAPGRYAIDYE
ncbi:uncharacterized protein LOC113233821 isoform X2 [Hyposmocoma kahamanoa]|uniref:uncharacterized protein LOC113233821 isoform X2 n=1 Tax=Hyposmocoma kahamanoa TaxID=1477025 RepID=UPI000E6D644B|nr:uncharacterized protein LOC113233821 isoform X2 [Hyposmocoma kahamanoa]